MILIERSCPFSTSNSKKDRRGEWTEKRRLYRCEKTSSKKRIWDGPRAIGGRAHFFIQSSSSFQSSFYLSFPSVYPPGPILLVVRNFFHSKVEIIGFLFPRFSLPLCPLRRRYSSVAFHRKVPKCSISCQIWRFIFTIGTCPSLSLSFFSSFWCPSSLSRRRTIILKNRSCHSDIYFLVAFIDIGLKTFSWLLLVFSLSRSSRAPLLNRALRNDKLAGVLLCGGKW